MAFGLFPGKFEMGKILFDCIKGLWFGFKWMESGDGTQSKTSAVIASFHHPRSHTWRWAIYWDKNRSGWFRIWKGWSGFIIVGLPFLGAIDFRWQQHCWRKAD